MEPKQASRPPTPQEAGRSAENGRFLRFPEIASFVQFRDMLAFGSCDETLGFCPGYRIPDGGVIGLGGCLVAFLPPSDTRKNKIIKVGGPREPRRGGGESLIKYLRGKPTRWRVIPGRPELLGVAPRELLR